MNDARQQMLERIAEDESLTGDLGGDAAEQLRQWANDTALAVAQRTDLADPVVQVHMKAVRTAARTAAQHDGDVAVAQREFDRIIASGHTMMIPTVSERQQVTAQAPSPSFVSRMRAWWRDMWSTHDKG